MRFVALMMLTLCAVQAESGGPTYYFPHLAVGASWQTTITYINYSAEEVSCRTDFLSDQGTPLMVSFPGRGPVAGRSDVLPPGGSVHEETDVGLSAPLVSGWARADCTGPVKAGLLFRQYDRAGVPTGEAGVNAASASATRFVTFAEKREGQLGTGVAYANPSDTSTVVVTFTARDAAGDVLDSVDRELTPRGHDAQTMAGLFSLTSFTGSLEITSSEPIVTLSINAEAAPIFSSLPPGELDLSVQGPATYYFPHLAVGASWQTTITYINYSPQEVSCRTDFLSDQGTPLMVSFPGRGPVASRSDVLPPGGSVHEETDVGLSAPLVSGWARADCTGPVKAGLLFRQYDRAGVPTGEAGVNAAAAPATRFVTFAEKREGQPGTAVAYANPSGTSTAVVTFTARDAAERTLDSVDRTLMPRGHGAQTMADLFSLTSFTGSLEITSSEPIVTLSINTESTSVFSSLPPGELDPSPRVAPTTDRGVLEVFYNSTGGPDWRVSTNWLSAAPLGEWLGVFVDGNGRVTGLNLGSNKLSGEIPPELGNLANLEGLVLGGNELSGEIPPELGNLANLEVLDLAVNELSGEISSELGNLANLEVLNLGSNELSGEISSELGDLANLEVLVLGGNELSGEIPSELGELAALKWLNLGSNKLSGEIPSELGDLTNLEWLYLGYAGYVGHAEYVGPAEYDDFGVISDFYDFLYLALVNYALPWDVRFNELSGEIPPELGELANLERLNLGGNELSGEIPPELGDLANLEWLDLGFNELSGEIPPELGDLTNLEVLYLGVNELSGEIPPELGDLTNLEWLNLGVNELSEIPPELGDLTNLEWLNLGVNELSEIPPELGDLTNLEWLNLGVNELSEIPPELGDLTNLPFLDLGGNKLSEIPPELGDLTNLASLNLGVNKLSEIPPELGDLTNLASLNLRVNKLSEIPPELGDLTNLAFLDLGGNELSGGIPPELGDLANLEWLDLGFNQNLGGTIPSEMWDLSLLSFLSLMATSVCAPQNSDFQKWVETIEFLPSGGASCGGPDAAISVIDVAVFYTPAARRIAGGTAGIETLIDLRVAETNQAYVDSGVNQRLFPVAREEVQYVDASNDWLLTLSRLIDPSDGYMDEVHELRDRYGADLVHLIDDLDDQGPSDPNTVAGQQPGPFSAGAPCVHCSSRVFAHALGHNMGLSHDRYASRSAIFSFSYGGFSYSHGYVNQQAFVAGDPPQESLWQTIMANPDQCGDAGFHCDEILRFSNPNQTYLGELLGVPGNERTAAVDGPADAVRTLNITRHSVAAFRTRTSQTKDAISRALSGGKQAVLSANAAGGKGGVLFRAVAPKAGVPAESDAKALRRREVRVDIGLLNRASAESNPALTMNLFDDVTVIGLIERRTPTYSGGHALTGRLLGIPGGTMALVVNGDAVAGAVRLPGAAYRIRPAGAGRHAIIKVDPSQTSWRCGTGEQTR